MYDSCYFFVCVISFKKIFCYTCVIFGHFPNFVNLIRNYFLNLKFSYDSLNWI